MSPTRIETSPRARRIANEWQYLLLLADENPSLLEVRSRRSEAASECFDFGLTQTPAYAALPVPDNAPSNIVTRHEVTIRLPDFYPAVPCEAFLKTPLFHPNIHPHNGFVCLWDRFSVGDGVIEAVQQLQRIISWHLYNSFAEHVMQPDALARAAEMNALDYQSLRVPQSLACERAYRGNGSNRARPRLSEWSEPGTSQSCPNKS